MIPLQHALRVEAASFLKLIKNNFCEGLHVIDCHIHSKSKDVLKRYSGKPDPVLPLKAKVGNAQITNETFSIYKIPVLIGIWGRLVLTARLIER